MSDTAAGVGGLVWIADGGACDTPGVVANDTRGKVLRSSDHGASWEAIAVRSGTESMETAASRVIADRRRAGHVAVLSASCTDRGATYGGTVWLTRNGGKSWRRAPLTGAIGRPEVARGDGAIGLALVRGKLENLSVWFPGRVRLSSSDAGEAWRPARYQDLPPPGSVSSPLFRYITIDMGVLRHPVSGGPAIRVFPK